ncbi:MAG: 4Fe-4S binding protein [Anaerolineae bacterium]|nr:4Fe-4S binding protein [Anaerolineae bacterium]
MPKTSLYHKLVNASALMFGKLPGEERILWALSQTIPEEDLRIYFLIPFGSTIPLEKLARKAARLGYDRLRLEETLERLYQQAFVMRHHTPQGVAYESCPLSMTAEQQVRMRKGSELGKAYADYWLSLAEVAAYQLPTRTPYFRILPVERTIQPAEKVRIEINHPIPDPRQVLPLDVVSQMVRQQKLIGVAECYCRLSRQMQGAPCSKPHETCFVFNQFAQSLIDLGIARPLSLEEALEILEACEKEGLVHNIDNFQGEIRGLCNCCACCCPGMKATAAGKKNIEAVSRYRVVFEAHKCAADHACVEMCPVRAVRVGEDGLPQVDHALCLGCGLCVSVCPQGALHLELRQKAPAVPPSAKALQNSLMREALVGFVWKKISGR